MCSHLISRAHGGEGMTEDERWALADYLRMLTFAAPPAAATPEPASSAAEGPATVTPVPALAETGAPVPQGTPGGAPTEVPAGTAATPQTLGTVSGSIENNSSAALPPDLKVTLHGFDHAQDAGGPQEVVSLSSQAGVDGAFTFPNVALLQGRIFLVEVEFSGVTYISDFAVVEAGATQLVLPPTAVYDTSEDFNLLKISQVHMQFVFGQDIAQVQLTYVISNASDKAVVVSTAGLDLPFVKFPAGAANQGFDSASGSAPFLSAQNGFAMAPSDQPYALLAFYSLPYDKRLEVNQPFVLPVDSIAILLPEGMKTAGAQLTDRGVQAIQNANYQIYTAENLPAGSSLTLTISGKPRTGVGTSAAANTRQNILIGAGAFGVVLILVGIWLYLRDRSQAQMEDDEAEDEFETADEVTDAIITLDDLHRAGKIPDDAYQKRRAELKARLKELL